MVANKYGNKQTPKCYKQMKKSYRSYNHQCHCKVIYSLHLTTFRLYIYIILCTYIVTHIKPYTLYTIYQISTVWWFILSPDLASNCWTSQWRLLNITIININILIFCRAALIYVLWQAQYKQNCMFLVIKKKSNYILIYAFIVKLLYF